MKWISSLTQLTELCLQPSCPLCQRPATQVLCLDCQRQIQQLQLTPDQQWQLPLRVWASGSYNGTLKRAITTLKYEPQPRLAQPLGHELAQSWLASTVAKSALVVVPIPMYAEKQRQRGFNQAELIARHFCHHTGLALKSDGLRRIRSTEAQFGLSPQARATNLTGAFEPGNDFWRRPPQQPVLLLDDIYTTGATAKAAAEALRRHQISVYGIVVVAKVVASGEAANQ